MSIRANKPTLSLVIPTCQRDQDLQRCLEALVLKACASIDIEVVITNDGPIKPAVSAVPMESLNLILVTGPCKGPAANRNAGAKQATGDWLVFLDDDCVPDPDFLLGYANYIASHPEVRALEGRTYPGRPQRSLAERGPFNEKGSCFYSCNIALRRDLFEELGGFDEDYEFSLEDLDLYTRLIKKGELIAFVPEAAVMHPQKEGLGWGFFWSMQRGRRTYLRKHPDQASSYSCEQMWKIWIHDVCFRLLPDIVRFRGRGLGRRLVYEGLAFCAPLLLKLPDRKTRHV